MAEVRLTSRPCTQIVVTGVSHALDRRQPPGEPIIHQSGQFVKVKITLMVEKTCSGRHTNGFAEPPELHAIAEHQFFRIGIEIDLPRSHQLPGRYLQLSLLEIRHLVNGKIAHLADAPGADVGYNRERPDTAMRIRGKTWLSHVIPSKGRFPCVFLPKPVSQPVVCSQPVA
jgi:hypothetical protein